MLASSGLFSGRHTRRYCAGFFVLGWYIYLGAVMMGLSSRSVWSRLCSYRFGNGRIFLIMCLFCSRALGFPTVTPYQSLVLLLLQFPSCQHLPIVSHN
jgi:hypothetical protein